MTTKEAAKDLINKFYQPLGYLNCGTSPRSMWEYAKERAIECVEFCIERYEKDQYKRKTDWLEDLVEEIKKL